MVKLEKTVDFWRDLQRGTAKNVEDWRDLYYRKKTGIEELRRVSLSLKTGKRPLDLAAKGGWFSGIKRGNVTEKEGI